MYRLNINIILFSLNYNFFFREIPKNTAEIAVRSSKPLLNFNLSFLQLLILRLQFIDFLLYHRKFIHKKL